ncbi:T-cell surface glycoprotein CD8 beta chain [Protopterus annectens]|uniref:T-cell surface glycoprotein CD8 beta chain n=1 Tax=Protopterus annectens TaxID=7888 RepID=UPI001CF937B7|nr:T-cell surface glycoprotein CD8 beta chain [Protopterus annectens]
MNNFHILCYVLWWIAGVNTSVTLVQTPGFVMELVNKTTQLLCSTKNAQIEQQGIYWYRRPEGSQELQFIAHATVLNKLTFGEGFVKDRIVISKDNFRGIYTLKISELQPSDNGTYYCVITHSAMLVMGNGTDLLVVNEFPTSPPTTTQKPKCRCPTQSQTIRRPSKEKGLPCSSMILCILLGSIAVLAVLEVAVIICFKNIRRPYPHYFLKQ